MNEKSLEIHCRQCLDRFILISHLANFLVYFLQLAAIPLIQLGILRFC